LVQRYSFILFKAMTQFRFHVNLVDLFTDTITPKEVVVENGVITQILPSKHQGGPFMIPGFVDAHVHVESSLLPPAEFARMAVVHGTVCTVSDPHEIANVTGVKGVEWMIENGKKVPFKFHFGAPSCVPATPFETAGATISVSDIRYLFESGKTKYLAEMMNWPGVLFNDEEVFAKIKLDKEFGFPVDGHAPGLLGEKARKYAEAGISTDHECFTYEEGLAKIQAGMKVLIREGSAAKNFEALIPLLGQFPAMVMFCSDDKHPDSLLDGHINQLVKRAAARHNNIFHVLRAASLNPIMHYKLPVGLLRLGDPADFLLVDDLHHFHILETWIDGEKVASSGDSLIERQSLELINQFQVNLKSETDFEVNGKHDKKIRVIEAIDGQLITNQLLFEPKLENGKLIPQPELDILKLLVVNRYNDAAPAIAFIKNFGLKKGAIASSVGHDSHNITAIGLDDASLAKVVNAIIENKGGLAATDGEHVHVLPLPIAGLMSDQDGYQVADLYTKLDRFAKDELGSTLGSPFMTLSFMALLVIPELKLSDKGLFNGLSFEFVGLQTD